jgi:hypothetical protein
VDNFQNPTPNYLILFLNEFGPLIKRFEILSRFAISCYFASSSSFFVALVFERVLAAPTLHLMLEQVLHQFGGLFEDPPSAGLERGS